MELIEYNLDLMNEECFDHHHLPQFIDTENLWNQNKYDTNYGTNLLHPHNGLEDYDDKNDDGQMNTDNHQDEYHEVDLFELTKEQDQIKCNHNSTVIAEPMAQNKQCHSDSSKYHRGSGSQTNKNNDPLNSKIEGFSEKYSEPKSNRAAVSVKDTTSVKKLLKEDELNLNKTDDSCGSSSNGSSNQIQNFDEGSLIFLIRKIDRKTNKSVLLTKHRKKITKCSHVDLEYYAKGMCKN